MKNIIHLIPVIFLIACVAEKTTEETLIAKIGDKSISVNEFIRRAEYTIRPAYCRSDLYVHRKIVLNSLIAEKLMAIEAGEENELTANEDINLYLQGRKEQSMRQWLYNEEMYKKVNTDSNEIKQVYRVAGHTYDLNYLSFSDPQVAHLINNEIDNGTDDISEIYRKLGGEGDVPERKIGFNDPEPDIIHNMLFSETLKVGQFIGPVKAGQDTYLLLQVKGWTRDLAMTTNQANERFESVTSKLRDKKANVLFDQYVGEIMSGKRMDFVWETFEKFVNIVGPDYYKSEGEKQAAFNKKFWNKDNPEMILDDLGNQMEQIMDQPLFSLNNEMWTVRMLQRELKIHPLVFRKQKMAKTEFAKQLKLAIVDMIRDKYITEDAYNKGYDQVPSVRRNYNMWRDNLLALYQREQFLKNVDKENKGQMAIIEDILTPYSMELYNKYTDNISINTDALEKTELTSIDMFVIQKNVPYPVLVPSFPQVTTHNKLDYGSKLNPVSKN